MTDIKHKPLMHGWWYHYRIHMPKTDSLCSNGFSSLKNYLNTVSHKCPDDYFLNGPRSSKIRKILDVDLKEIQGHEVSTLARLGLESDRFTTAHTNVQMFMLQNDNTTIGVEVPIWMFEEEYPEYKKILESSDVLTGHIDALRIEGKNIWVWDYKPNAHKEKYASTQVQFYAMMLSKRTGIPIDHFRCGYFDSDIAYVFKPLEMPEWK